MLLKTRWKNNTLAKFLQGLRREVTMPTLLGGNNHQRILLRRIFGYEPYILETINPFLTSSLREAAKKSSSLNPALYPPPLLMARPLREEPSFAASLNQNTIITFLSFSSVIQIPFNKSLFPHLQYVDYANRNSVSVFSFEAFYPDSGLVF